jgi:hypothetical protein
MEYKNQKGLSGYKKNGWQITNRFNLNNCPHGNSHFLTYSS